ncbi:hypothetical protein NQ314_005277 [Rhamnusium bicolor]|uniref:Ketosynthase family 3 (KS3) domain-containing protein n=1 Tax=Rhamnusium bicolor TaxID=1586634 RepID=A0AAV8ZKA3_9CUCU|nr:hypothetical protein NQ314_005277 [Rhamnusium bicolor]
MVKQNKGSDEDKEAKVISNDNLNMVGLLKSIKPGEKIVISGPFLPSSSALTLLPASVGYLIFHRVAQISRVHQLRGEDRNWIGEAKRHWVSTRGSLKRWMERPVYYKKKTIEAILDAGLHPADLENTRTGVYIGTCASETEVVMCKSTTSPQEYVMTGCPRSMQAHRLSYFLKLKGPSFVTDTACSSSLYAFEHAFRALMLGEIDNAIVGGTNLCLHPFDSLQFARLGVLSMSGTCNVFDEKGDGYVRSEAIGVVLLQKYKNAKRMYSEVIYAKTNCDGYKEQGITYPSREVQTNLLKEFYEECNIDPNSLSYLEAHGTGTTVGDPEECSAIDAVLTNNRKRPLLVGSSIIGMETGFIPPNINFTVPRDKIRGIIEGRMKVVTDKMPFEDNRGLVAVNSFGFGGGNCHILIRWNPKEKINGGLPKDPLPRLVCVSGRTEDSITSLLDDFSNNKLDAEHVALIHNIFRTQKYLLDKGVDISNILIKKTPHSNTYQILGSVMVQIGIIDTLQLLEIKPIECIGYSFGVLSAAYYDGSITLEETINCALVIKRIYKC